VHIHSDDFANDVAESALRGLGAALCGRFVDRRRRQFPEGGQREQVSGAHVRQVGQHRKQNRRPLRDFAKLTLHLAESCLFRDYLLGICP